jgi:Protein of unknown function (DUF1524)
MSYGELASAAPGNTRAEASRKRESLIQTLGNLTILSSGLNSAQSNLGWEKKRPEMAKHSLLPINQNLLQKKTWDEDEIAKRGSELFDRAKRIWAR